MHRDLLNSLAAIGMMGVICSDNIVRIAADHDGHEPPRGPSARKTSGVRLNDKKPEPKEKSAGLKRMLKRKGRGV